MAALVVPKSLGYAGIAGVPIQHGLYAAAAGTILYVLFGTARQISTGPSSALAAVAGSAVVLASVSGDEAVELVSAITLVTGLLFLLLAIFKMGWISLLLSKAVIAGSLFGAAIEVVIGELPKITGTSIDGANAWRKFGNWIVGLDDLHGSTVLVGVISLVVIVGIRFSPIKIPGALVLVAGGLVASVALDFEDRDIALVGEVPRLRRPEASQRGLRDREHLDDRTGRAGSPPDRVLSDRRRRQVLRVEARIPDRHQSGVGGTKHGQHRIGCTAGRSCVDEPVGEFAQR